MPIDTHQKRCISWIAVSSKPQTEKESPDEQRNANLAIINDVLNGRLVAQLEVPGESREIISFEEACTRIDAYAQLRDILKARSADILVCRDMSRLGRTAALAAQVVAHCHAAGIAIYSIAMPPQSLDAREQAANQGATITLALEGALSQIEMTKLKRNHMFGMLGRAKRGLMPKGERFGWRAVRDARGNVERLEIVEEQAECIRFVIDAYTEGGRSVTSIYKEMNRRGMTRKTGIPWSHVSVINLVDAVWAYAGYIEFNKHSKTGRPYYRGKGAWPAIITEAQAQRTVDERKRRAYARRGVEPTNLFSGVARCGYCGDMIIAAGRDARLGKRYRCKSKCAGASLFEKRIVAAMLDFLDSIKQHADTAAVTTDEPIDLAAEYEAQKAQIEHQLASIAEHRKRHARNNALGILDDTEFRELMQEAANQRLTLETHRQELETRIQRVETEDEYKQRVEDIMETGRNRLLGDDIPAINAWLRLNFEITIHKNRPSRIHIKSWGL